MTNSDQMDKNIEQQGKQMGSALGKKLGKAVAKQAKAKLLPLLLKFFAATAPFWVILIVVILVFGAVYATFPGNKLTSGQEEQVFFSLKDSEENKKVKDLYIEIANKNNFRDSWLNTDYITTNTDVLFEGKHEGAYTKEEIINLLNNSTYTGTHGKDTERVLSDYYGIDKSHKIDFGIIHAANYIKVLVHGEAETTDEFKEQVGEVFRPYLYYKESSRTYCSLQETEEGPEWVCHTENVYLLTEANTIKGHYKYEYEWVEESGETWSRSYEALVSTTLLNNEWERLDLWITEVLGEQGRQLSATRLMLIEAGVAFTEERENVKWLLEGIYSDHNISTGIINPALMQYFMQAENAFGFPSWFLQAIAFIESGLDPEAYNNKTQAYGLMQLLPGTQKRTVDKLVAEYPHLLPEDFLVLYHNTLNKDASFYKQALSSPSLSILAGCVDLMDKGLDPSQIDWEGDWQNQTLKALAGYGGHVYVPQKLWAKYGVTSKEDSYTEEKVLAWAKDNYVQNIWDNAEKFQIGTSWPFEGSYPVTADFKQKGSLWTLGWHTGVDFAMDTGTPLLAMFNGEVVAAGYQTGYGKTLVITNYVYDVWYAHLDIINVTTGKKVSAGQTVAYSGNTGTSTGPHLHLEVRPRGGEYGNVINPLSILNN